MYRINHPSVKLFFDVFDDIFEMPIPDGTTQGPLHDVVENDKEFITDILMAGIKKEDISVEVEKDTLVIKAERKGDKDLIYNRKQTFFGKYERKFILPDFVDKKNIGATYIDGILTVTVPKILDKTKPGKTKIEIK